MIPDSAKKPITYHGIEISRMPRRELTKIRNELAASRVMREPLLLGTVTTVPPESVEALARQQVVPEAAGRVRRIKS